MEHDINRLPAWARARIGEAEAEVERLNKRIDQLKSKSEQEARTFFDPRGYRDEGTPLASEDGRDRVVYYIGDEDRDDSISITRVSPDLEGRSTRTLEIYSGDGPIIMQARSSNIIQITVPDRRAELIAAREAAKRNGPRATRIDGP